MRFVLHGLGGDVRAVVIALDHLAHARLRFLGKPSIFVDHARDRRNGYARDLLRSPAEKSAFRLPCRTHLLFSNAILAKNARAFKPICAFALTVPALSAILLPMKEGNHEANPDFSLHRPHALPAVRLRRSRARGGAAPVASPARPHRARPHRPRPCPARRPRPRAPRRRLPRSPLRRRRRLPPLPPPRPPRPRPPSRRLRPRPRRPRSRPRSPA